MLARVFATATCLSVCLSVRPSLMSRYCVKTKKPSVMINFFITWQPHDSIFLVPNFITKF